MHALVTEAGFGDSARFRIALEAHGVRVSICHGVSGWCRAVTRGTRCPLDDRTDPVDMVIDVRGPDEDLSTREYGLVCGLRANRPVFVVEHDPKVPAAAPTGLAPLVTVTSTTNLLEAFASALALHRTTR